MTGFQSKKAAAQGKLIVDRTQVEQWLEALKDIDALHHSQEPESVDAQKAIADMGQALAQPEQEPVCDKDPQGCWNVRCQLGKKCKNTPPAAQRTWVDLTDDEIDKWTPEIHGVIREVLAQFKEKNT